jgi:hypothetical protein
MLDEQKTLSDREGANIFIGTIIVIAALIFIAVCAWFVGKHSADDFYRKYPVTAGTPEVQGQASRGRPSPRSKGSLGHNQCATKIPHR